MNKNTIVFAAIIGNILEWFDYALYGINATILAKVFFSMNNSLLERIFAIMGIFLAGSLMRPLGGFIIGHIGDRYSVRIALVFSILLMGINTFFIGVLPSYAQIGVLAPIILIFIRLLQGIAVGGELPGSFLVLHASAKGRPSGFRISLSLLGAFLGFLLAAGLVMLLFHVMGKTVYQAWGWRVPFWLSILLVIIGLVLRLNLPMSESKDMVQQAPVVELWQKHRKLFLLVLGALVLPGTYSGFGVNYVPTFLISVMHESQAATYTYLFVVSFMSLVVFPISAYFADRMNDYFSWVLRGSAITMLCIIPLYYLVSAGGMQTFIFLLIAQAMLAAVCSPLLVMLVRFFPANIRYSAVALTYGLAMALIGGSIGVLLTGIIHLFGPMAVGYFFALSAAVTFYFMWRLKKIAKLYS